MARFLLCALSALCLQSCVFDELIATDGTSVSRGPSQHGALFDPVELPAEGRGYVIPPTWQKRGLNFGIDELTSLVVYAGRMLEMTRPGLTLSVGDMSRAYGGPSAWHRSHQTGRDVDLLFLVENHRGEGVVAEVMHRFDRTGRQVGSGGPPLRFAVAANWLLVKTLIENPIIEVQYIFIQDDLRQMLLEHAQDIGEPEALIQRAAFVLHQPGDSAPHDDHMHVRVYCPESDRSLGCRDFGALRWHKKGYGYQPRADRVMERRVSGSVELAAAGVCVTAPVLRAMPF